MKQIPVVRTVAALRRVVDGWRREGARVALVPTMGALHEGHVSLVRIGRRKADKVVASIFVNPAQFAPTEDFSKYPRTFPADRRKLTAARCDLIFAPTGPEMYPEGFATTVSLAGPPPSGWRTGSGPPISLGSRPSSPSCSRSAGPTSRSSARRTGSSCRS